MGEPPALLAADGIDRAQDRLAANQRPNSILPARHFRRYGIVDSERRQLGNSGVPAHEAHDLDTAPLRQHGDDLADGAIGGVLDHPLAVADLQVFQQHQRTERHGDQLACGFVVDRIRQRHRAARGRDEIIGPCAFDTGGNDTLADRRRANALAQRVDDADRLAAG